MESTERTEKSVDDRFYDRADSLIHLANEHCSDIGRGKVSASFLFAASRFNAWVSACGFDSEDAMRASKEETLEYFVAQYKAMLEENLDDYIANFKKYMQPPEV
nr:DUF3144 domain-containing protein [uncultured Rhodoferax sp.]